MLQIKRETFEERLVKYLESPSILRGFMEERLKTMPKEELAYLLATHDKFRRIGCAEYASDDEPGYIMKASDGENVTETRHEGQEPLPDPLGRIVDPYGRPVISANRNK